MDEAFLASGRAAIAVLHHALQLNNLGQLAHEAHKLKGACGYVSATKVKSACLALKTFVDGAFAAMENDSREKAAWTEQLTKQLKSLIARLEAELHEFGVSVQANKAPQASKVLDQNRYTYADPTEEQINEKEHAKKLLSWNKEVYEARVAKAFVEERLVRALYQQQVQQKGREIYQRHHELVDHHKRQGAKTPTLYVRKKLFDQGTQDILAHAMEEASPRFNDTEALSPRLDRLALSRRGLGGDVSSLAKPASSNELRRSIRLPHLNTLMNPRNQVTSPLPEKETLMPQSARKKRANEKQTQLRALPLPQLLKMMATCWEEKRLAEIAKMRAMGLHVPAEPGQVPVIVPLDQVVENMLTKEHGISEMRDEKLEQLYISCSSSEGHGSHPRVSVFRLMAGWEDDPDVAMKAEQETACMQLLSWLNIASSDPPERDLRMLLRLKDAQKMIEHLYRLRLVDDTARMSLYAMTEELRLGKGETSPRHAAMVMCDADELLWRWMEQWGSWEPKVSAGLIGTGAAPAGAPAPSSRGASSISSMRRRSFERIQGAPAPAPESSSRGSSRGGQPQANGPGWRGSTEQARAM